MYCTDCGAWLCRLMAHMLGPKVRCSPLCLLPVHVLHRFAGPPCAPPPCHAGSHTSPAPKSTASLQAAPQCAKHKLSSKSDAIADSAAAVGASGPDVYRYHCSAGPAVTDQWLRQLPQGRIAVAATEAQVPAAGNGRGLTLHSIPQC